ncbi:MAG: hypothetical protein AAB649_00650 [Patescibacteria group bacterium]
MKTQIYSEIYESYTCQGYHVTEELPAEELVKLLQLMDNFELIYVFSDKENKLFYAVLKPLISS